MDEFSRWRRMSANAQADVNRVLAELGAPSARVLLLSDVHAKLAGAPIDVQEYFHEAIICLQTELTRSAIVVSWSGFFSIFCEKLYLRREKELRSVRPKWSFADSFDLRESYPESQIIEAAKDAGLIRNPKRRMLDGWLSQRNQCAHPTVYRPTMNTGIGYVDSMIEETLVFL